MTSVLEHTPLRVQAEILHAVIAERWPKMALGAIAHRFSLTLEDLQALLYRNGYPGKPAMTAAARRLEAKAAAEADAPVAAAEDVQTEAGSDAQEVEEPYTETLATVKLSDLLADPNNPRENLTGIAELAESIQSVGLLQPIVARRHQGRLYVVAGHRRRAALIHLKHTEARVIIRSRMMPDDVLAAMLIENGQRTDLDPIEEARALRTLKTQLDCNDTELGHRIGRSMAYVNGRLLLLNLSAEEQEAIRAGQLGVTAATSKARMDSGRVRPGAVGRSAPGHLSTQHQLADRVRNRCTRLGHSRGKGVGVGGVGCGACWESVIRADEREHIHLVSAQLGKCATCDHPMEATA